MTHSFQKQPQLSPILKSFFKFNGNLKLRIIQIAQIKDSIDFFFPVYHTNYSR